MTNDETQRKMDFIVEQQAQFSADIQQLKELHARTDNIITRIASATLTLTERMVELAAAHSNLAASQEHTDQRLNALIDIVRNGRNGQG